ncbi:MAG: MATE family efflux transporter [Spirochaetia bacterium]|nr:MATE family efflux transporter [Spirochaetia bacterium]
MKEMSAQEQYEKMINTPVWKLIATLAIPTVISMLVTSLYNVADTFFVSQLGTQASAATGIAFPIMTIIQAFGFTLGMGSGSLISINLGQKKNDEASSISSTAFFTAFFLGILIAFSGHVFLSPILKFLGASETILPFAHDYANFIFWGAPFMCASFVMNNDLRAEGKSFLSMNALALGAVMNIFLDPIFIFGDIYIFGVLPFHGFGLGIKGAAITTLITQLFSFSVLLSYFINKKTICRINIKLYTRKISLLFKIISTGIPSLARQGMASIAVILLNTMAGRYGGDSGIAAMSIVSKICMCIGSIMIGIGQGFTPVSGYNFGAKRYDRVKESFFFLLISGFSIMSLFTVICAVFAPNIISVFRQDEEVIRIGTQALRFQIMGLPLHSFIIGTNMLFQSTRHVHQATFLSINRQGVYFIPSIIFLPLLFNLTGVEISQLIADILSAVTAIPYVIWILKKLD